MRDPLFGVQYSWVFWPLVDRSAVYDSFFKKMFIFLVFPQLFLLKRVPFCCSQSRLRIVTWCYEFFSLHSNVTLHRAYCGICTTFHVTVHTTHGSH